MLNLYVSMLAFHLCWAGLPSVCARHSCGQDDKATSSGWKEVDGRNYKVVQLNTSWEEALSACNAEGGFLGSVNSSTISKEIAGNYDAKLIRVPYEFNKHRSGELILVDERCLQRIVRSLPCCGPLTFARRRDRKRRIPNSVDESIVDIITYEDDASKDYWMFRTSSGRRAVLRFNTTRRSFLLASGVQATAHVPESIPVFLRRWQRGRFLQCTPVLIRDENVTRSIPLSFADSIAAFRDFCEQYNVTCFLFDGALLGWFRECSIVPHTTDFDFGAFRSDHSEALIQAFINSAEFRLIWILGLLRDSFEVSVRVARRKIDLFYVYDAERGLEYSAGMNFDQRQQMRWYRPRIEGICTGDLLNKLVYVPCNPADMLKAAYGDRWFADVPTPMFDWVNSPKNVEFGEVYSKTEFSKVVRMYDA